MVSFHVPKWFTPPEGIVKINIGGAIAEVQKERYCTCCMPRLEGILANITMDPATLEVMACSEANFPEKSERTRTKQVIISRLCLQQTASDSSTMEQCP
jgi:hypothetical protein